MIFVQFCLPIYSPPRYNFSYWTSSWGGGKEEEEGGAKKWQGTMRLRYRFTGEWTRISSSRNIAVEKYLSANFYHCFRPSLYTCSKVRTVRPPRYKILGERSCNRSLNRVNIQGKIWYSMRIFPDLLLLTERRRVGAFRNQVLNPRDLYSPRKKNLF